MGYQATTQGDGPPDLNVDGPHDGGPPHDGALPFDLEPDAPRHDGGTPDGAPDLSPPDPDLPLPDLAPPDLPLPDYLRTRLRELRTANPG